MATFDTLQNILAAKFALSPDQIQPDASLEALGLDSLDSIEVLFDIEEAFQIRIPQERTTDTPLVHVKDLVNLIDGLVTQQQASRAAG